MSHTDLVSQSEVLWIFKMVQSNFSFSSSDNISDLFSAMFVKNEVANDFQMSRNKVAYSISHGLQPYFYEELCDSVQKSNNPFYSIFLRVM